MAWGEIEGMGKESEGEKSGELAIISNLGSLLHNNL